MTLTEKWKKGELESGWYYVKCADGLIGMMSDYALYRVNLEHPDNKITLLAKMPSYEEWQELSKQRNQLIRDVKDLAYIQEENQQLRKWCEEFNALDVAKENQRLKELLRECYKMLAQYHVENSEPSLDENIELLTKIDNATGEKK